MTRRGDHYAECPECGELYAITEGHDCEWGAHIPPRYNVRVTVQDSDDNDVEIPIDA